MNHTVKADWGEGDIPAQTGRTILVTGASNGLGAEAARMLSAKGARVLMAVRSLARGEKARQAILDRHPGAKLDLVPLDLADLESVAAAPSNLAALGVTRLDVLLNNAGLMMPAKRQVTRQGFEAQFGVNHLGHFALTRALFPLLAPDGRVVSVSSIADRRGGIRWEDVQWERAYDPSAAYGQSKTANQLFILELTRRLRAAGSAVLAAGAHPGIALTNLATDSILGRWLWLVRPVLALGLGPKVQSAAMGALPEVYASVGEIEGGAYIGPAHRIYGPPVRAEDQRAAHSADGDAAARLWRLSETLTGGPFEIAGKTPSSS